MEVLISGLRSGGRTLCEFWSCDHAWLDMDLVIKNAEEPLYNFLAANQQVLSCLIPGTWTRLHFHTRCYLWALSTSLSASGAHRQKPVPMPDDCARRWTETSLKNISTCDSWMLATAGPLAFLITPLCSIYIFFPAGVFLSFPSLAASLHPIPVNCVRGERSQAPVMFAAGRLLTHYAPVTSLQKQSQACDKRQAN